MPSQDTVDAFWSRVDRTGDCWTWLGATRPDGRGWVRHDGAVRLTHRVAWILSYGPIPVGLFVCHRCDNPPCCRPEHLFLGTRTDNMRDARAKGRLIRDRTGRSAQPAKAPPARLVAAHRAMALHPESHPRGVAHWTHQQPERISRGERNGGAHLTESAVREIRRLYETGQWSKRALGARFSVTGSTVAQIVHGHTWRHLLSPSGHSA